VYYDQYDSNEQFNPLVFAMPGKNPLTAIDISLNKADITCGHYRGNIRVMNNLLTDVEQYHIAMGKAKQLGGGNEITKRIICPSGPKYKMITSRVHWHALPVSSLVYDSISSPIDPLLYSGGDESVLVTWQISQGRDRPVDVQPRLALGGIVHLSSSDKCDDNVSNGVLVFCEDNTLQLLDTHNKGQIWKIQGLATGLSSQASMEGTAKTDILSLESDRRSAGHKASQLIITGLSHAPGYIHWFNPDLERVSSSLEVAPFNRISRTEPDELPLPAPRITCHAFSGMGEDLITVDECPTENPFVGAPEEKENDETYGIVTTIRFWSWNDHGPTSVDGISPPYNQVASMTFPHGPKNRISAIGISKDGIVACTVSHNEKAFRVWQKEKARRKPTEIAPDADAHSHSWICRYKVSIPAGFSNLCTGTNGVSFSEDSSILAVSFGQYVTLWDADEARLLTSFCHSLGNSDIDRVQFVNPGLHRDLLLIQSCGGVTLRSVYGGQNGSSASFDAWTFTARFHGNHRTIVTASELIESHACIAISLYAPNKNESRVILINAQTGSTGIELVGSVKEIEGCIIALSSSGMKWQSPSLQHCSNDKEDESNTKNQSTKPCSLSLYGVTTIGNLFLFTEDLSNDQQQQNRSLREVNDNIFESTSGPRLDIGSDYEDRRKRQRTHNNTSADDEETLSSVRRLALDVFGYGISDKGTSTRPPTADLPSLSGNFVKSFVARNLSVRKNNPLE
jgi:NET1-associated nuclear protein 1 (U3 small nucleolar RNA-associated protein 17)